MKNAIAACDSILNGSDVIRKKADEYRIAFEKATGFGADKAIYHLVDDDSCETEIKKELEKKLDAMAKRQIYSQYKTAPTEKEREKARQEYLDKVGISPSFRW